MNESSNLLGQHQTVSGSSTEAKPTTLAVLYSVGDVAESISASVTTVKRMAAELRLDLTHTVGGVKLFTEDQVGKLKAERIRRQQEAWK